MQTQIGPKLPTRLIRHAGQYRTWIRQKAGLRQDDRTPIIITNNDEPPIVLGNSHYWSTKTGRVIRHPSAYKKKGFSSMVYNPSTIRVEVGRDWLIKNGVPLDLLAETGTMVS